MSSGCERLALVSSRPWAHRSLPASSTRRRSGWGVRPSYLVYSLGTSGVVFTTSDEAVYDEHGIVDGVADAAGGYLPLMSTLNAARVTDTVASWLGVDHAALSQLG